MKETFSSEFNWWQRLIAVLTGMWRINSGSIDFKWGYFAPRWGFSLLLHRGGYFDQRYAIHFHFIWGAIHIYLPLKTRIPESCNTPKYGIEIHNSTFWIHLGGKMNDSEQCDSKWITCYLPFFSWVHDWHRLQLPDGTWIPYSYDDRDRAYSEKHGFRYVLNSGKVQHREAKCFVEERQWHRKWFPFLKMNKRVIDVSFSDEVGERTGSWKGGTVGCSYDLLPSETIVECLRRMEKERKF